MSRIARRYAAALLLAAQERSAVDEVDGDLRELHGLMQDAEVRMVLGSPEVTGEARRRFLDKLTAGRHELVGNLVQVLLARHRTAILPALYPAWRELLMAARNEAEGFVDTPRPLGDEDLAKLRELAARLTGKKVNLATRTVPDLIGGVRLQVGNELYDGSVKNALEQLQRRLLEAPM